MDTNTQTSLAIANPLTGQSIDDEQLRGIADLAKQQLHFQQEIEMVEKRLEDLKDSLRQIQEDRLPDAMQSVGLESFRLSDGTSITVDKFYAAKIPDDMQVAAFKWLRDHDFDAIIKRNLTCKFGKGEDAKAEQVKRMLQLAGVTPDDKAGVHPQTLKAFVREQIETGKALPMDLFGVFVGNRTKVTPATK